MVDPQQATDLIRFLAIAVVGACLVGLSPNPCHHADCAFTHKAAVQRDKAAERQRYHETWHDHDFPGCEHCDARRRP